MTREQLRAELLSGADAIRNSVVWRFMSAEQRNLSICGRQFWTRDNGITNAALDDFAALLSTMQAAPPMQAMPASIKEDAAALWALLKQTHSLAGAVELLAALLVMALGDRQTESPH